MTAILDDGSDVARGRQVRIDGKTRTIPAGRVARFEALAQRLAEQYPDRTDLARAALTAAAVYLLDTPAIPPVVSVPVSSLADVDAARTELARRDTERTDGILAVVDQVAAELADARAELECATIAARTVAALAAEDGITEVALTQHFGIDRGTLRRWIGKRDR